MEYRKLGYFGSLALAFSPFFGGCGDSRDSANHHPVNNSPIVQAIPNQMVKEGDSLDMDLGKYVSDKDGDPVTIEKIDYGSTTPDKIVGNHYIFTSSFDNTHLDHSHRIHFEAKDGKGGVTKDSFWVEEKDVNQSPVIQSIPQYEVTEGGTLIQGFGRHLRDPENDKLTIRVVNGPGRFGGTYRGSPLPDDVYIYEDNPDSDSTDDLHTVGIVVDDGRGGQATGSFQIKQKDTTSYINKPNNPPVIQPIPDQMVKEGNSLDHDLSIYVSDKDNDPVTIELISGVGGITNNKYTYNDAVDTDHTNNSYIVGFRAKDGRGGEATGSFNLTQQDVNRLPAIKAIPDQVVAEGASKDFDLDPYLSDADGDPLTVQIVKGRGSISNRRFLYQDTFDLNHTDDGYIVELEVEDSYGGKTRSSFNLTQQDVNRLPVIKAISDQTVIEGRKVVFDLKPYGFDADNDALDFELVSGPGSISNGQFNYDNPYDKDLTDDVYTIVFRGKDGHGGEATGSFKLTQRDVNKETIKNLLMQEAVVLGSWWHDDYEKPQIDITLKKIHELGGETIFALATWYQSTPNSLDLGPSSYYKTPTDAGIENVISKSQALGMRTGLKIHVDTWNGSWRGNIKYFTDADWAQWFKSYTDFATHYAKLAEKHKVDMLVIGTELEGTVHRPEWGKVISDVRKEYPSGEVLYSAHWNNYKNVPFWKDLDGMGIGIYFSESEFSARAQEARDFAAQQNKKLYVLEVGCQSRTGAGDTPWWSNGSYNEQAQANYYKIAFDNLYNKCGLMGIWHIYHNLANPDDFPPNNKLAESVVNDYFHRMK